MLKRRPPLTTFETRLTCTTVSSRFSFEASIFAILLPLRARFIAPFHIFALEIQAYFTSALCDCSYTSMIGIASTIKDNFTDALFFRPLGNKFTHFTSYRHFPIVRNRRKLLNLCLCLTSLSSGQQSLDLSNRLSTSCGRCTFLWRPTFALRLRSGFLDPGTLTLCWGYFRSHLHSSYLPCLPLLFRYWSCRRW